jgi:hypothetical protein
LKLLTFHTASDTSSRFGALLGRTRVLDLTALGGAIPRTLLECIEHGDAGLVAPWSAPKQRWRAAKPRRRS